MNSVNSTAVAIKFKLVLVSVLLLSSCSFFNSKNNENDLSTSGAQPESFKQVVSPLGNPTTTAIEVATEFYDVNNQQRPDFMPTVEPSSPSSLTSVDEVDDEEEAVGIDAGIELRHQLWRFDSRHGLDVFLAGVIRHTERLRVHGDYSLKVEANTVEGKIRPTRPVCAFPRKR